jgi:NitT/TauT family transport system substrate-binding protein
VSEGKTMIDHAAVTRRLCLRGTAALLAGGMAARAEELSPVRLGILQFGTVQWLSEVVRQHALDRQNGFALETKLLANTDAGRIALLANAADIVVSDWMFVAAQRAAGVKLCFAPFSSSTGGVMVPHSSAVQTLPDLANRKLGVAGGPMDKSWLVVRAAIMVSMQMNLATSAQVVYGAPPLLNAKLMQGELDAVLTYWNFAARLEASGCRQIAAVDTCARRLGLPSGMPLIGFVFHEDWATRNKAAIDGFLTAAAAAQSQLAHQPETWQSIRPVMDAPDDALFEALRRRFIAGIASPSAEAQQQAAEQLFTVLVRTGGTRATDGLAQLPPGIFWPTTAQHG